MKLVIRFVFLGVTLFISNGCAQYYYQYPIQKLPDFPITDNLIAAQNGGKVVFQTSEGPGFYATNLIDGKISTREKAFWNSNTPNYPQEIIFSLSDNKIHLINKVIINPFANRRTVN